MDSGMNEKCGRSAADGSGLTNICELPAGHCGEHRAYWRDRDGKRRESLRWRYERDGCAVFPGTPGAVDVTRSGYVAPPITY